MDSQVNNFENVLDDDEEIVKTYKPNKFVLYFKNLFSTTMVLLFISIYVIALSFVPDGNFSPIPLIIYGVVVFLAYLISVLLLNIYYKNILYAYTNKRILIKTGVFGVDFKSLDLGMIGANSVNVSIIDKILKKNTGTLNFGSMASPMMTGSNNVPKFLFSNIENPYEVYKEIKAYIAQNKDKTTITIQNNKEGK